MKKSLMGILLVMAIAITACGATAQPETAPVNDTASEAEAPTREEISLEVVEEEAPVEDAMAEDEMSADEMMEEDASADEMMEEDASTQEVMEEETSTDEMMEDEIVEEEASADEMMGEAASTHDMVDAVADAAEEAMMEQDEATDEMMEEPAEAEMFGPDWFKVELADATTGETFKVADLHGKVVLVETMAVWCPICTQQQQQISLLHDQLGERDDFVSLSLDIDPNESHDFLKSHVERHGFNWSYAIAPPEVSREIGDLYGQNYLNPPAAPMLIIDRQGEAHLLPFGVKSVGELQEAVTPFLNNEG